MKGLALYRQQIALIKKQRDALDEDLAQVLAEAVGDGHKMLDVLGYNGPSADQIRFDL